MKFFHLSDLHIGMQMYHYNLREDQEIILREIVSYAKELCPEAVIIAGDIYDKSIPSAEAVAIFDRFLTELADIKPAIPILIISGNHDSAGRLSYAAELLKKNHIYLAGQAPSALEERIYKITIPDAFGEVDFYLLPFFKPSHVRNVWEGDRPETYQEAVDMLLSRENIDYTGRRNVLVSHQFYTGGSVETCDSETVSVGGVDQIDVSVIGRFDYAALGHLHGPQEVGRPSIRYCGSPMKYSVSESNHTKSLTLVELKEKGKEPEITCLPLHPLRDVKKKRGLLKEIIENAQERERDDYISVTLTDETDPYRPKDQLEKVYSHILEVKIDNARTRNMLNEFEEELAEKDPYILFGEFFREIQGREMNGEEKSMLKSVFGKAEGE